MRRQPGSHPDRKEKEAGTPPPRDNRNMQITWLGHGTFQFELPSGEVLLMDPWVQGNPSYPEGHKIEKVNAMCITHGHFDHVFDAVALAKKFSPEVVAIY